MTHANPFRTTLLAIAAFCVPPILVSESLYFYGSTFINHDIAWILYGAQRLREGAELGIDIFAVNPPLVWWLSTPVLLVAQLFGAPVPQVFVALVACVVVISGALAASVLKDRSIGHGLAPWAQYTLVVLAAYTLFPGAHRDFGQREYIALVFALPYLAQSATGSSRGTARSWACRSCLGAIAGVGFLLKPYFLAVPLLVEIRALWRRDDSTLVRPELAGLVATTLVYAILLSMLAPQWFHRVLPVARLTFGAFEAPLSSVIVHALPALLGLAGASALRLKWGGRDLDDVLLLACLGFTVSYFVQMKGYSYHAFPMRTLATWVIAIQALRASQYASASKRAWRRYSPTAATAVALLLILISSSVADVRIWRQAVRPEGRYFRATVALTELVQRYPSFLALSTHPYPGFPTALYTSASWGSRTNSKWLLPAVAAARARKDFRSARQAEEWAWEELVDELRREPAVVLVDPATTHHGLHGYTFDLIGFYLEDAEIRELWRRYQEIATVSGYRVFELAHHGVPND